ncbi:hypothetical protein H8356DRAFT_949291 [Neocallimastix lanati (nom. inval.)]|uniref:Uncharacterized protein n=1 Tax=Neocallimastix californiae TaxID=1754190 RepID=A0A1Y1ZMI6_9FUNG|nr:hypothetical protein H8356DRAFT_949291 [Neocallimastix sp. JGI-2020a]ORY11462.1 hypothetical protein LY90DRAFT_518490 [Neocallimastix californiae]|eukprot:ORY11462.1 hypothetical protein LY90DRAFT_518490 [Neocallimastix californiae]
MKGKQLDFYKSSINCINPYGIDYVKASLGYPVQEEKKNTSDTSKSTNKYVWNVEKGIVNTNPEIQKQLEYYCQDLDQFNCKLNYFLEQINCNNPINGPVFIYCNLVDGTGINYIAALLSCLGYYYVHSFSHLNEIKKKYSDSVIQFIRNSSIESIIKKNRLEEFQDLKDLTYSNDYKTYIKTSITSIIFDKLNELFQQGHSAISTSELTKQCKKFPHNIVLMSIQYFCRRKIQFIIQNTPYLLKMINYTLYLEPIYHSFIPQSVLGSTTPLTSTIPITISSSSTNNNTNTNTNVNTDSGTNDANITFSDINSLTHQMKNIALVNSPTLFNLIESKDSKKESSSYQKYELPAILFNNLIYNAYRTKNYLKVYDFLEGYTKLEHCYLLEYALIHHLKFIKKFYEAYWLQENSTFYISLFISFSNHSFNTHGKLIQNTSHQTWIESPINPYYFNYYHDIFSSSSSSSSSTTTTSSTIRINDLDLYFQISLSIKSQNSDNNNSNNSNKSIPVTELHNNIKSSSTNKTDLLEEEDEHFIASLIYSLCFDEIENDINSDYLITKENNLNNIISKIKYYCQQETNAIQKVIHHVTQEDIEDYCQNRPKQAHILYNILEMIHGRMISPDQFYQFIKKNLLTLII